MESRDVEEMTDAEGDHSKNKKIVVDQKSVPTNAEDQTKHDLLVSRVILWPIGAQEDVKNQGYDGQTLKLNNLVPDTKVI